MCVLGVRLFVVCSLQLRYDDCNAYIVCPRYCDILGNVVCVAVETGLQPLPNEFVGIAAPSRAHVDGISPRGLICTE